MKGSKLISSSACLSGVHRAIVSFYCGSAVTLTPVGESENFWTVSTGKGLIATVAVIRKAGRFRFVQLPEGHTISEGGAK